MEISSRGGAALNLVINITLLLMLQTNNGAFVVQKKGELPEGRSQPVASNSSTPYPFNESEIDRELNELRNKTKDF